MTNPIDHAHISEDEFIDYFDGALEESASERIERHVADCAACAEWTRQSWRQLSEIEDWTARSHGQAALAVAMNRGLVAASKEARPGVPDWKARLERWLDSATSASAAFVRSMRQPIANLATVPVLGPLEVEDSPQRTVKLAAEGLPQETVAKVAIDDHRAEIEIRIDGFPRRQRAPLMMLIPTRPEASSRILALQKSAEGDYLHALFADVEPGDYIGCFEPQEYR